MKYAWKSLSLVKMYVWVHKRRKCMIISAMYWTWIAMYLAWIRIDSLSLNDCVDQSSLRELRLHCVIALSVTSSGMNCVQVPSASLPLQADSHSRSSFVPSRVTRSQLSFAARERHVSIVGASEWTRRTLLKTIVCKSARIARRGTDRSFASDRLSLRS